MSEQTEKKKIKKINASSLDKSNQNIATVFKLYFQQQDGKSNYAIIYLFIYFDIANLYNNRCLKIGRQHQNFEGNCEILRTIFKLQGYYHPIYQQARKD